MTARGFTDYWLAGSAIFAGKSGASCEIDLELLCSLHQLHVREAVRCAYEGKRNEASHHRELVQTIAGVVRENHERRKAVANQEAA